MTKCMWLVKSIEIPTPIENKHFILVDEVTYKGGTIRAATDTFLSCARPEKVIFSSC